MITQTPYHTYLAYITSQQERMESLVEEWVGINTHYSNLAGLEAMSRSLVKAFSSLGGEITERQLPLKHGLDAQGRAATTPLGKLLSIKKNRAAPVSVLLVGHMDTVFPPTSLFQQAKRQGTKMEGPGVIDLKGGLAILLVALETLERSPYAQGINWEVLINPDEEIGSVGSSSILMERAQDNDFGLVFEPLLPDGAHASARKGSATYSIAAHGKSAHAGRDHAKGKNAIVVLLKILTEIQALQETFPEALINIGTIKGGDAPNIVPELAVAQINVRGNSNEQATAIRHQMQRIVSEASRKQNISSVGFYEHSSRPSKLFDKPTEKLFTGIKGCAELLGMPMTWHDTGGVCDGNNLAAAGLPTIDSMGAEGGKIHTTSEFLMLESLSRRACLAALVLMQMAERRITV